MPPKHVSADDLDDDWEPSTTNYADVGNGESAGENSEVEEEGILVAAPAPLLSRPCFSI